MRYIPSLESFVCTSTARSPATISTIRSEPDSLTACRKARLSPGEYQRVGQPHAARRSPVYEAVPLDEEAAQVLPPVPLRDRRFTLAHMPPSAAFKLTLRWAAS
jgi:hypothetical protein